MYAIRSYYGFYPEKAKEFGIPKGQLWNKIQNGEQIEYEGKIIRPDQILGEKRSYNFV